MNTEELIFGLVSFSTLRYVLFLVAIIVAIFYFYKKKNKNFSSQSTKNLDMFAVDLTQKEKTGDIDPVFGRETEVNRVTQILTRRTKNNVILVGPPGVGKTAIVEGLASRIARGEVPEVLANKRVLLLQVSELLAGTKYRGEFEQRIKGIVEEIKISNRSIILFIDEIHTISQTKGTEGAVSLSDILKPALARGDLQLIGATTQKEYEQYIEPDESWSRRFQVVLIDEPTVEESIRILQAIKPNYEEYHKVRYTDEAIEAAARLSEEYITSRKLPDKAIDLMDEAAALVNVKEGPHPLHHSVGILHGAGKKAVVGPIEAGQEYPQVTVDHVKEVVAECVDLNISEIH